MKKLHHIYFLLLALITLESCSSDKDTDHESEQEIYVNRETLDNMGLIDSDTIKTDSASTFTKIEILSHFTDIAKPEIWYSKDITLNQEYASVSFVNKYDMKYNVNISTNDKSLDSIEIINDNGARGVLKSIGKRNEQNVYLIKMEISNGHEFISYRLTLSNKNRSKNKLIYIQSIVLNSSNN